MERQLSTAFTGLGLSEEVLRAVRKIGYTEPTPVQAATIPLVLKGRDVCAAASTGTGKTAAFLLPTMSMLPRAERGKGPKMLVVSPTRELASQIGDACLPIARETGHYLATVYGGTSYGPQIRKLKRGVDILIATPGRLNDLRDRGVVDLSNIDVLVLDEADRMLDMGFLPAMEVIIAATPDTRQTLLFSATIDRKIMNSVGGMLRNPELVEIAQRGTTAATVEQYVMPITQREKPELLRAVLDEKGSDRVIVFARTKFRAEECAEQLCEAGYSAESIHSDKSQGQRKRALENFSRGKTKILVATDVLARGIDVTGVHHVINYDLPDCPEDYVHRIGRTGRAGEEGYAISFVSPDTRRLLKEVEKLIGREIPFMDLEGYDLDESLLKAPAKRGGRSGGKRSEGARGGRERGERGGRGGRGERERGGKRGADERGGRDARGSRNDARSGGRGNGGRDEQRARGDRSFDSRDNRDNRAGRKGRGGKQYASKDQGGKGYGAKNFANQHGSDQRNSKGRSTEGHSGKSYGASSRADEKNFRGGKLRSNGGKNHRGNRNEAPRGKAGKQAKGSKRVPDRYKQFVK